jgi:hypothetical protein
MHACLYGRRDQRRQLLHRPALPARGADSQRHPGAVGALPLLFLLLLMLPETQPVLRSGEGRQRVCMHAGLQPKDNFSTHMHTIH